MFRPTWEMGLWPMPITPSRGRPAIGLDGGGGYGDLIGTGRPATTSVTCSHTDATS